MKVRNKVVVVTGGASGIGAALAQRFSSEGAKAVVVADLDEEGASHVASSINGSSAACDVANEEEIKSLIANTVAEHGSIDLFVSNAGYVTVGGLEDDDSEMKKMFDVHVMSHLYAARHAIPHMVDQGGGWLLNTSSAAGLLTQIGSLHYSVTKHAAVALAEWIQITYGDKGIGVSVLCPQAVETNIVANSPTAHLLPTDGESVASMDGVLSPEELAEVVIESLEDERFHVLPHADVKEYVRRKGDDIDRWLTGMRRFQNRLYPAGATPADWLLG
ncbi:MAG: 4-formylbenzenesulfonate dehydrogenase TsaC1/TsaC2 [Acidimicrobiales bacterium AG-410-I20]|nr:MAG: 4-formylbenzenesulfonate dehydrogenase TsaC1/TsaC2 [Acidimicrobiales bacterium AG-410-I20]